MKPAALRLVSALIACVMFSLAACTQKPDGAEFIGKWQSTSAKYPDLLVEIAKNGESFLLTADKDKLPATLNNDGTLQVAFPISPITFAHSKNSDTLIGMGSEFKRVK